MKTFFVVNQIRGAPWDASKPIRSQTLWDEHAAFMDQLTSDGFIVLGGPMGDPEGEAMLWLMRLMKKLLRLLWRKIRGVTQVI
jgi:hypothetical protein